MTTSINSSVTTPTTVRCVASYTRGTWSFSLPEGTTLVCRRVQTDAMEPLIEIVLLSAPIELEKLREWAASKSPSI